MALSKKQRKSSRSRMRFRKIEIVKKGTNYFEEDLRSFNNLSF